MSDYECLVERAIPDFVKDPDSTIDFAFNWAIALDDDTISSSDFLLPDGLTEVSSSFEDAVTQIFVSGGTDGAIYRITNRIVTAGGRTQDKTINIAVREQ